MKLYLIRMMCSTAPYYPPMNIEQTYVWAEDEEEARIRAEGTTEGMCVVIDTIEMKGENGEGEEE